MGDRMTQRVVLSVLKFLRAELEAGTLNEDSTESLEVAVQCLESAYNVDRAATQSRNVPDLMEVFATTSEVWPEDASEVISEENKAEAEKLKNVGNSLMKEEKFIEAIENYSNAITLDPTNAVYYCNRAAAHSKLNNHLAAIQDCKNAIKLDPTYSKAYGRLGIAYSSLNQHEDARNSYLKALQLEPENESYKNNLQLTNDQIAKERANTQTSAPGGPAGLDITMLLNNPTLMNMASQMLSNPNMQNIMSGLMTSGQGETNVDALLQAGQQLAQQMQSVNPEFVENLRRQMSGVTDPSNPEPKSPKDDGSGEQ